MKGVTNDFIASTTIVGTAKSKSSRAIIMNSGRGSALYCPGVVSTSCNIVTGQFSSLIRIPVLGVCACTGRGYSGMFWESRQRTWRPNTPNLTVSCMLKVLGLSFLGHWRGFYLLGDIGHKKTTAGQLRSFEKKNISRFVGNGRLIEPNQTNGCTTTEDLT